MNKYTFKTNINCADCIAKVAPHLNQSEEVKSWSVDTDTTHKILSIETNMLASAIIEFIDALGFEAVALDS